MFLTASSSFCTKFVISSSYYSCLSGSSLYCLNYRAGEVKPICCFICLSSLFIPFISSRSRCWISGWFVPMLNLYTAFSSCYTFWGMLLLAFTRGSLGIFGWFMLFYVNCFFMSVYLLSGNWTVFGFSTVDGRSASLYFLGILRLTGLCNIQTKYIRLELQTVIIFELLTCENSIWLICTFFYFGLLKTGQSFIFSQN